MIPGQNFLMKYGIRQSIELGIVTGSSPAYQFVSTVTRNTGEPSRQFMPLSETLQFLQGNECNLLKNVLSLVVRTTGSTGDGLDKWAVA